MEELRGLRDENVLATFGTPRQLFGGLISIAFRIQRSEEAVESCLEN